MLLHALPCCLLINGSSYHHYLKKLFRIKVWNLRRKITRMKKYQVFATIMRCLGNISSMWRTGRTFHWTVRVKIIFPFLLPSSVHFPSKLIYVYSNVSPVSSDIQSTSSAIRHLGKLTLNRSSYMASRRQAEPMFVHSKPLILLLLYRMLHVEHITDKSLLLSCNKSLS